MTAFFTGSLSREFRNRRLDCSFTSFKDLRNGELPLSVRWCSTHVTGLGRGGVALSTSSDFKGLSAVYFHCYTLHVCLASVASAFPAPRQQTVKMTDCRLADEAFGPAVLSACRTFDFTLLFEQSILSLLPNVLLLVLATWQTTVLSRKPTVVRISWLFYTRMVRMPSSLLCVWLISPGAAFGAIWAHSRLPCRGCRTSKIQNTNLHRLRRHRVSIDRLGCCSPLLRDLFQDSPTGLAIGIVLLTYDDLHRRPHSHLVAHWRRDHSGSRAAHCVFRRTPLTRSH